VVQAEITDKTRKWWELLYTSDLDRKIKQLWKSYLKALPLGEKLRIWFADENGICGNREEDIVHLFKRCVIVSDFSE
jgi:hypothetical protein